MGVQVRILRRLPWLPRVFHPAALAAALTLAATLAALALAAAVAAALATRPTAALAAALRPAATPHRPAVTLAPVSGQRHRGDRPPRGRDPRHEPSARDHTRSRAARGRGSCRYRGVASHAARGEAHAVPGGCARRPHTARDAPPLQRQVRTLLAAGGDRVRSDEQCTPMRCGRAQRDRRRVGAAGDRAVSDECAWGRVFICNRHAGGLYSDVPLRQAAAGQRKQHADRLAAAAGRGDHPRIRGAHQ